MCSGPNKGWRLEPFQLICSSFLFVMVSQGVWVDMLNVICTVT